MTTIKTTIAGVKFRKGGVDRAAQIAGGSVFGLVQEPLNAHDPHAIKVIANPDDFHLGYIPRVEAPYIDALMNAGIEVVCSAPSEPKDPAFPIITLEFDLGRLLP